MLAPSRQTAFTPVAAGTGHRSWQVAFTLNLFTGRSTITPRLTPALADKRFRRATRKEWRSPKDVLMHDKAHDIVNELVVGLIRSLKSDATLQHREYIGGCIK